MKGIVLAGGMGTRLMRKRMRDKSQVDLDGLFQMAADSGVRILVCEQSLDLLGLTMDDPVCSVVNRRPLRSSVGPCKTQRGF